MEHCSLQIFVYIEQLIQRPDRPPTKGGGKGVFSLWQYLYIKFSSDYLDMGALQRPTSLIRTEGACIARGGGGRNNVPRVGLWTR